LGRFATIENSLTNARAFQLFQLMRQGGLIVIAVALAKAPLSVAQVGNYEMLTYLGYLLTFFWVSGFMQGLLSQYPTLSPPQQQQLFFQSFVVFTGIGLGLALLLLSADSFLLPLLVQRTSLPYLGIFIVFLVTNLTASLQEHFYLLTNRKLTLVLYGALSAGAQMLAVALPLFLGYDFAYSFWSLAMVGILKWCWLLLFVIRRGRWHWSGAILNSWWLISWPLGLYALVAGLNQSLGPWLVGYFFAGDTEVFALYRYGARELPLLSALAGALGSALIPAIAHHLQNGLKDLREESVKLYHLLFPITILLLLTAHWWFPLVFSADYQDSVPLFRTFLLLTPAHLLFARTVLVAKQDTRLIPFFAVASFCLQLFLGFLLVPVLGLNGVALAAVLAFSAEKALLIFYVQKKYTLSWWVYTPWRWWLFYSAVLLGAYFLVL
jgi:O-antigen/teichoic acid export membrane protein